MSIQEIGVFKGRYPKQIWILVFSEMWERFCFYGMRGMLIFFMISKLDFDHTEANLRYGATQAFACAFAFVGGLLADKILGFRKSLIWGGILMMLGSSILAVDPHAYLFFGISFIAVGTGFFKPNISTMVGLLYKPGDLRKDSGFLLFYAGINLGSLLGGYTCIAIGKGELFSSFISRDYTWNAAFFLTFVAMLASLISFSLIKGPLGRIDFQPTGSPRDVQSGYATKIREYSVYVASFFLILLVKLMVSKTQYTDYFMYTLGPVILAYLFYEMSKVSICERKKLLAALIFVFFSIFFWGIYEQSGGSLNIFAAKNLGNELLGIRFDPNGVNNSGISFSVIFMAPLAGLFWTWLHKRGIEPSTVVKFGLGFVFLGLGYYVLFFTRFFSSDQGVVSLNLFSSALFIVAIGELCLSPIGLSIMTQLATKNLQGMMMGVWFLSNAYGQYVAGLIGAGMAGVVGEGMLSNLDTMIVYTGEYKMLGIYSFSLGVLLVLLSPMIRKLMGEVR